MASFRLALFSFLFAPWVLDAQSDIRSVRADGDTGSARAVVFTNRPLVHTGQLLPDIEGTSRQQVERLLLQLTELLETAGHGDAALVRLEWCVRSNEVVAEVQRAMARRYKGTHKPAVSFVTGKLRRSSDAAAVNAIAVLPAASRVSKPVVKTMALGTVSILPAGGVTQVSGQAERGKTSKEAAARTLDSLLRTLEFLELTKSDAVQFKVFLPIADVDQVVQAFTELYGTPEATPPIVFVEWLGSALVEIEMVAAANPKSASTGGGDVAYLTPPGMEASPVYCRVVGANSPTHIYVSSLTAAKDNAGLEQARDIYTQLESILAECGSDLRHLVKATYYVSDQDGNKGLVDLRPSIYQPQRPPAASKATVAGTGFPGRTLALDMIAVPRPAANRALAAHWPLIENARDISSGGLHGTAHGVRFSRDGAQFDGRASRIEIPSASGLDFGTGDFSLALWVRTEKELDDTLGDLVSKYDPERRAGFNLTIQHNAGTGSQANYRNLHFGIDNAQQDRAWTDRGRPGKAIFIHSLAVHQGNLYAGTVEGRTNADQGHVYRYAGGEKWEDLGAPWKSNGVTAMASYNDHLYVGVSRVLLHYSGLEPTLAHHIGGKVFRYESGKWIDLGQLLGLDGINGMAVFRGKLYVTGFYQPGLFRYEGGTQWTSLGSPDGMRPEGLIVRDGALYASGYDEGAVYRYDGEKWTHTGRLGNSTQVYGQGIYQGKHLAGTWEFGTVYRHERDGGWVSTGRLGNAEEVMGPNVYNGKFYAGTLPLAEIFRYDGDNRWTSIGRVDTTPDVMYRRAWSMAVFQGKLFTGTLPSGHVRSFEAGRSATYDSELPAGWRHVAAVRDGKRLVLYVDGKVVARSAEFDSAKYALSNGAPLQIGFGQHDYFNGMLRDVRVYKRALSDSEIAALVSAR